MAMKVPVKRDQDREVASRATASQPELWSGGFWEPVEHLHREMDRIFDHFFDNFFDFGMSPARSSRATAFAPRLDAWADDDGYHVEVELPGVRQKDLEVTLSQNLLTIRGKKERGGKGKGENGQERWHQEFERSLTLPDGIDVDRVEATLKDGLLHLSLPKCEGAKPRRIAVKSQ